MATIRTALSKAGKSGRGGVGRPEFIITTTAAPDIVIVVECKATVAQHESPQRNRPADFAVDGVLHYARALSPHYTVVAVAVSGDERLLKIDNFLLTKGETQERLLIAPTGADINEIVPLSDYLRSASFDPAVEAKRTSDLISFSQTLHVFMRDEAELEEKEKPLLVAGTLIALHNEIFANTYQAYPARELPGFWIDAIQKEVKKARLPVAKVENMTQPFTGIEVHPELRKETKAYPKGLLNEIVTMLAEHVLPFLTIYHDFDVVGRFYGEFLKYTGGDGKGLGIVLTPKHVTELFAQLANVGPDDVVVDPCTGTGGFLISAMVRMASMATTDRQVASIKSNQLIGVEQQATMYALGASNMILRGDGKANLHQGSCFDTAITGAIRKRKPTVGLINPPYSKSKADLHELRFVEHMLDMLAHGGRGIAIVPMSCATAPSPHKAALLSKHTLEAVMSMPTELFHPVSVVTCVMVFTAGIPHATSNKKTWFGYWREDGFVKTKHLGRIDQDLRWSGIRDHWVASFRNREVHAGESVMAMVGPDDEWVAEAYMETDYATLTQADLEAAILDYALFSLKRTGIGGDK
ncbi:class I SAM-dependent DNA methyltransferase [Geodermatophilus sp. SYSU D00758]